MGKGCYMKLKGSQNLRLRLLVATLSSKSIIIEDIRADSTWHELLILLGLFGKKPLTIRLKDAKECCRAEKPVKQSVDFHHKDLSVAAIIAAVTEGLELKIESRGVAPKGGGEVVLSVPMVPNSLTATKWVDKGLVKRIRGVSFSTRVSVQFENTMIHAARGILNPLLADVHIFTDHKAGAQAGMSPGYGISLVAETTSGCVISADTTVSYARGEDDADLDDDRKDLIPAEEVGEQIATALLGEIKQGGSS
ncbi:hypothetical protein KY289_028425 [Solanum tuberosum]|nr:hypothetical protein KY289_028425 [Solanum tuberosum]